MHYDTSPWSKGKSPYGFPQRINWWFEYAGAKRCIPVIFRFPEGIVFDIITFLDEEKLCEFFEKYEAVEAKLTPLQRRCAEQEHPYQAVPVKELWINGKRVEGGYSSSGTVSIPWAGQGDELTLVRKAYSYILRGTACFACERFCIPYPETNSEAEKLMRLLRLYRVNSIKLSTRPVTWFYPLDIKLEMKANENHKEFCIRHPKTGEAHTLYFQHKEPVEIPFSPGRNRSLYAVQSMYEIEPPLPSGDTLQFNSSMQYTEPPEDGFSPTAASSIGIIGGAFGPAAIFTGANDKGEGTPCGSHGLPLHSCFSGPSFHKEEASHFVLEGINIKRLSSEEIDYGF